MGEGLHQEAGAMKLPEYENGDDLKEDLPQLKVGSHLLYHGILHMVIDAGSEQGHRIAAVGKEKKEK